MMYQGDIDINNGALHVEKKNREVEIVDEFNPLVILDSLHLFYYTSQVSASSRDCIEITVMEDRRRRIVQAGNNADYALNPFSDWTVQSSTLRKLNNEFSISE